MSFIKKAIKKVFKFAKRLVKNKVFQIVAVIALSVFTAGLAAGGFAAFGASAAAAGGGITGFFSAVGSTLATGASVITGALGMSGTSAALAGKGGLMATSAGLTGAAGTTASTLAAVTTTATPMAGGSMTAAQIAGMSDAAIVAGHTAAGGAVSGAAGGWTASMSKLMGKKVLGDLSFGQLASNAAVAGFSNLIKGKDSDKKMPNGYVAGDVARGGGGYSGGYQLNGGAPIEPEEAIASNTQSEIGEQGETLASQMARAPAEEQQDYAGGNEQVAQNIGLAQPQAEQATEAVTGVNGQMTTEPGQQGLVPSSPFSDEATRIAYDPNKRGLMGAV